jgi:hypothetical protein
VTEHAAVTSPEEVPRRWLLADLDAAYGVLEQLSQPNTDTVPATSDEPLPE